MYLAGKKLRLLIIAMKTALMSLIILSSIVAIPDGNSATVYQWTDEDGIVHFSDTAPPADNSIETREIKFDSFDNGASHPEKYSIIEQANIMAEWRRQETEQRIALQKLALEKQRLNQEMELNRQNDQYTVQDGYQPGLHYYVFPGAIGYSTRRPWNYRQNHWHNSGSHAHKNERRDNVSDYVKNGKGLQLYMSGRIN